MSAEFLIGPDGRGSLERLPIGAALAAVVQRAQLAQIAARAEHRIDCDLDEDCSCSASPEEPSS